MKKYDIEHDDRFFPPGFFVKELYDLWKHLQDENIEPNPIIIDSEDLLANPAGMLSAYCNAVGLPYDDSLLKWDASSEVFQKMKASGDKLIQSMVNYYGTAMNSTCFLPPKKMPSRDELPPDVIRCSDKVMKYYDEMYECRLKLWCIMVVAGRTTIRVDINMISIGRKPYIQSYCLNGELMNIDKSE